MQGFKKGATIKLLNGDIITIVAPIGSGGTADTYKVLNVNKKKFQCAKHLYGGIYTTDSEKYYEKCTVLAKYKPPHPAFVWFEDFGISSYNKETKSFIYVMELLEGYKNAVSLIRDPEQLKLKERIKICTILAEASKSAIGKGLIYGDWSGNNVMWKKLPNGDISVRIIDCDPMSVQGFPLGLGGTGKYRSPEVMLGAEQSQQSDIFSLAVLSFRLFCSRHPLDGKKTRSEPETPETIMKYYAKQPIFIFDGDTNAPSRLVTARFNALPRPLQVYFSYMFSNGSLHGRADRFDYDKFLIVMKKSLDLIN